MGVVEVLSLCLYNLIVAHAYQLTYSVKCVVNVFLANGVVPASIVVSGILLACNHLLGVEKLAVGPGADLICRRKQGHRLDQIIKLGFNMENVETDQIFSLKVE